MKWIFDKKSTILKPRFKNVETASCLENNSRQVSFKLDQQQQQVFRSMFQVIWPCSVRFLICTQPWNLALALGNVDVNIDACFDSNSIFTPSCLFVDTSARVDVLCLFSLVCQRRESIIPNQMFRNNIEHNTRHSILQTRKVIGKASVNKYLPYPWLYFW